MGYSFAALTLLVHGLVRLAGLTRQTVEIEPGTLMNIWVPKKNVVKDNGKNVYVTPNKPAVLFLHSFGMNGIFTWYSQVLALTREYSVYVPDLLFFGGSITNRTERSTSFQAEFLAKGLAKLRVGKVTLVGLSYGGIIGFKMAKMYPNLVKSMVVSSTVIELTESISINLHKRLGLSSWSDILMPETMEGTKMLFLTTFHKLPWLPNFVFHDILENMFNNRKERNELLVNLVVPDKDATTDTNYSQRIHMLWGDDDKLFDLDLAETTKAQLGEKIMLECIKNAGHMVPIEQPFVYNKCLKRILQQFEEKR